MFNPQQIIYSRRLSEQFKYSAAQLFIAPMGFGKTRTILRALELCGLSKTEKALWIAPLLVAKNLAAEVSAVFPDGKHTCSDVVEGPYKTMMSVRAGDHNIVTLNYEKTYYDLHNPALYKNYQFLIFDESSKLAGKGMRFRHWLTVANLFSNKKKMLVSAAPIAGGLQNIYSQAQLMDIKLEKTRSIFIDKYFYTRVINGAAKCIVGPRPGAAEVISEKMAPWVVSAADHEESEPKPVTETSHIVPIMIDETSYHRLKNEMSLGTVTALNRGILAQKLLQICSGFCYDDAGNSLLYSNAKLNRLESLLSNKLAGERVIIWNKWASCEASIVAHLAVKLPHLRVGIMNKKSIEMWNNLELDILLGNPQSAGHGTNIYRDCSNMIFFSFDWKAEDHFQAKGRLSPDRMKLGKSKKEVADVYYLIAQLSDSASAEQLCYEKISGKIKLDEMFKRMLT